MSKKNELPRVGTKARTLLELTALSGEIPIKQAKRLVRGEAYYRKVITALKAKGLITSQIKDNLHGYRLTRRAKTYLLSEKPRRFGYYLSGNNGANHVRSEFKARLRLYCVAEVFVTMHNSGVAVYMDEKPSVFYPADGEVQKLPFIDEPSFFSSREVKDMGLDAAGIRGGRAVGILLAADKLFITYNAVRNTLKVDYKPEMRMKALARTTLCGDRLGHQYTPECIRGLLFGQNMEFACKLLCEAVTKKRNYFLFDGGYDHFHYLTNDTRGEVLLRILCNPDLYETLTQFLSVGLLAGNPGSVFENDAFDTEGNPILFAFDCDLLRINRFNRALLTHDGCGTLVCFDFQADALRRFCCESMAFQTIDFTKFERRFLL